MRIVATPKSRLLFALVAVGLIALGLQGCGCSSCGSSYWVEGPVSGNVFVDNLTFAAVPEDVMTFFLAAVGDPFTGNLLTTPVPPDFTQFVGTFHENDYDAEADMELGDLVQWFDIFVGGGQDVFFEVY